VQKYWSIVFGATMAAALLLFIVSPFVSGWWLPPNVATFGPGIDNLFYLILAITGFFFVLCEALLVYALWRYAGQPGRKADYVHGNHKLELIWTLVPGVILLLLAIVQINVWAEVKFQKNMPAPNRTTQQIEVLARQWEWRMRYPSSHDMDTWTDKQAEQFGRNPSVDDVHVPAELHVWQKNKVLIHLKTQDVLHSFFLPHLRLKQDALPGKTIPVWFEVTEPNVKYDATLDRWVETNDEHGQPKIWDLVCAEFCGARHSLMGGRLFVHESRDDFMKWLRHMEAEQNRYQPPAPPVPVAAR
jgi:cytochrome c oxidase subunit 2